METTFKNEVEIFAIISNAGDAKGIAYEALELAENYQFEEADEKLEEANLVILRAHHVQTKLITAELNGKLYDKSLLMIHAQDHLMTSISEIKLIEHIIRILKRVYKLENHK